jgi:hypothetical protein
MPPEIILNILSKLDSGFDIISIIKSNKYIGNIIINDINYIVSCLIDNNKINKKYISIILKSCYYSSNNNQTNIKLFLMIYKFIHTETNNVIDKNICELFNRNLSFSKITTYLQLRIYRNISHLYSLFAVEQFNAVKINNMLNLIKNNNFDESMAYEAVRLLDENVFEKMFDIIKQGVEIYEAIRAVNELNDDGIEKMFELISRNIPANNAIDAVLDLNDEGIEMMIDLVNHGIEPDVARTSAGKSDDDRSKLVYMVNHGVSSENAESIIENNSSDRVNLAIELIDAGIDCENDGDCIDYILSSLDINKINMVVILLKQNVGINSIIKKINHTFINIFKKIIDIVCEGVSFDIACKIVELFDDIKINKLIDIVKMGIGCKMAFEMVLVFDDDHITQMLKLISEDIDEDSAFNIINEPQKKKSRLL